MTEEVKEELHDEKEPKKKGFFGKVKSAIVPDAEEQAAIISTIPGVPQQKIDPTFIASVFTGVLASFGIQTASKKGDGTMKMDKSGGSGPNGSISKADMEMLIEKATQAAPAQTIRIEQAPIAITAVPPQSSSSKGSSPKV